MMDPFTQKLLERTKARREYVEAKFAKTPQPLPRKRRSPLKEENSPMTASSLTSSKSDCNDDDSPGKRQCVQSSISNVQLGQANEETAKENTVKTSNVDQGIKNRLKALAQFHSGDVDDPNYETPDVIQATLCKQGDDECGNSVTTCSGSEPRNRSNRLAVLAASINMWEDDLQNGISTQKSRALIESNSTPPHSSNSGSSLSSSASIKTPSSDSLTLLPPPPVTQTRSRRSTSPSELTPKLTLAQLQQSEAPDSKVGRSSSAASGVASTPMKRRSSSFTSPSKLKPTTCENAPSKAKQQKTKNMIWDQAIVSTLQAQGFVQSPSKSKLEYQFRDSKKDNATGGKSILKNKGNIHHATVKDDDDDDNRPITPPIASSSPEGVIEPPKKSVKELAQIFVGAAALPVPKPQKDPAELPLAARVALFEKEAASSSSNSKLVCTPKITKPPVNATTTKTVTRNPDVAATAAAVKSPQKATTPLMSTASKDSITSPASPSNVGQHTVQLHRQLFEHMQDWKQNEISAKLKDERQKDMEVVLNRWSYKNKLAAMNAASVVTCAASGKQDTSGVSSVMNEQKQQESSTIERRASMSIPAPPPLPGQASGDSVYKNVAREQSVQFEESLSTEDCYSSNDDDGNPSEPAENQDDNSIESSINSELSYDGGNDSDGSNGDDDLEETEEDQVRRATCIIDDLFSEEENSVESDCDSKSKWARQDQISSEEDCLDSSILKEAFIKVSPLKMTKLENFVVPEPYAASTSYKNSKANPTSDRYHEQEDEDSDVPLMHTVSFYRRQKEASRLTPVRVVVHRQEVDSLPQAENKTEGGQFSPRTEDCLTIQEKIKHLQEVVASQQTVMSQTSQALNLCRSTAEFHGSTQQIEGERLLLIATHKRMACMNEIQRLKTEAGIGSHAQSISPSSKGSVSISDLKLPVKKEFLQQTAFGKEGEFVHFFLCLVKHRAQVIATQMVSTLDNISNGIFHFPNLINLRELDRDFNVVIEVYGLQTKRDNIVKEQKTLANKKEKSKLTLTPKKRQSKRDLRMTSPVVQSPGGPSAVCTSSFSIIGFATINIKSLQRKSWVLEKCPYVSPLEGNLLMKVQCHTDFSTDEQGFLTMFEDVGGFGAWHRRWFTLSTRYLSYWKYPDDVKRKEPIGLIDLCQCVTPQVALVARDICARPHTFMLLLVKSPSQDDVDSLVVQSHNSYTSIKILLSADTKEERIAWCRNMNRSLENVRAWDPEALHPMPGELI